MRHLWRFMLVLFIALAAWLASTYHYVQAGQPDDYLPLFDYILLPSALVGFFWAAWPIFPEGSRRGRIVASSVVSVASTGAWMLLGMIIVVNFQLSIGGHL
jgi:hypothetical protein